MKKVEVEKLVSKSIIITAILLCLILGTTYIENGYSDALRLGATSTLTVVVSVLFAIVAVAMVGLGIFKNSKYYIFASLSAVIAIFVMLLKINYEIKGLEFLVGTINVKFYDVSMLIFGLAVLATWVRAGIKLIRG